MLAKESLSNHMDQITDKIYDTKSNLLNQFIYFNKPMDL